MEIPERTKKIGHCNPWRDDRFLFVLRPQSPEATAYFVPPEPRGTAFVAAVKYLKRYIKQNYNSISERKIVWPFQQGLPLMTWLPTIMTLAFFCSVFSVGAKEIVRKNSRILPNLLVFFVSVSIYATSLVIFNDGSMAFKMVWASGMISNFFATVLLA